MNLTVIIPVFNEEKTIRLLVKEVLGSPFTSEIIAVDDGSTDKSYEILESIQKESPGKIKVLKHSKNLGKGHAIRTALEESSGDLILIQDADLEYSPSEYGSLIKPFEDPNVQVVYGSRNIHENPRSYNSFYWGGVLLTSVANFLYGSKITDESTCYKVFKAELLKGLDLECEGFEFCPEVTAKVLKKKIKILEVPVTYNPRSKTEGKKIKWSDGLLAVWFLIKYKFKN